MTYKVYGYPEDQMLCITVNGWEVFGMTLTPVAPESREWLAQHLDESFQREHKRAAELAVQAHQREQRKLLGFKD